MRKLIDEVATIRLMRKETKSVFCGAALVVVLFAAGCASPTRLGTYSLGTSLSATPQQVPAPNPSDRTLAEAQAAMRGIDPEGSFAAFNERWTGAVCRIRYPVEITDKPDWELDLFGPFIQHSQQGRPDLFAQMEIEDRSKVMKLSADASGMLDEHMDACLAGAGRHNEIYLIRPVNEETR